MIVLLGSRLQHMEVPRLGVQSELQPPASTTATATATRDLSLSVAYPAAHGYAGSLTHGARPGIEPASSWTVVGLLSPSRKSGVFHFKLEKLSFRKRAGICQDGSICPPAMLLLGAHRLFPSWAAVLTQECLRCVFSLCAAHSPSRRILCGTQARGCAREDVCPLSTRAALAPEWPTGRGRSSSEPQYRKPSVGSSGEVGAPCVSWAGPGHSRAFHADLGPCWVTSRRLCLKLSLRRRLPRPRARARGNSGRAAAVFPHTAVSGAEKACRGTGWAAPDHAVSPEGPERTHCFNSS